MLADCADRAERLRQAGAEVVLVTGGAGAGREGLGWEPKLAFAALAGAYQAL
jgi:glutamate 5-kinase